MQLFTTLFVNITFQHFSNYFDKHRLAFKQSFLLKLRLETPTFYHCNTKHCISVERAVQKFSSCYLMAGGLEF